MINDKKILGLIPARGGSKRLPNKNILPLGGKPLIVWAIMAAQASRYIDRIILSSDDQEIIKIARLHGCDVPFVRPAELSTDKSDSSSVALNALDNLEESFDYLALIQPTSPFVQGADIDGCIDLCIARNANSCVSVSEASKPPFWTYTIDEKDKLNTVMGDIDNRPLQHTGIPTYYTLNGSVFVAKTDWLRKRRDFVGQGTVAYQMEKKRSIDIDTQWDLTLAETLLNMDDLGLKN